MKKKPPYDPVAARNARLAERDAFERRQRKFYKEDAPPRPAVQAPARAYDKIVSKLYPNG